MKLILLYLISLIAGMAIQHIFGWKGMILYCFAYLTDVYAKSLSR